MRLGQGRGLHGVCGVLGVVLLSANAFAGTKVLFEFDSPPGAARRQTDDARVSVVERGGGKSLRVEFGTRSRYPSVRLKPQGRAWDLSGFGYVEAVVTNAGGKDLSAALRVDNRGAGNPWNAEHVGLKPGQTEKLRVWFGRSWGKAGYRLDPSGVVGLLVYLERPVEGAVLLVDSVVAGGKSGGWKGVRPAGGVMLDFGREFDPAEQLELRGAEAAVAGSGRSRALRVTYEAGGSRRGVYLKPQGVAWDLRDFTQVEVDVRNSGARDAEIVCRVDNRGAADGRNSSIARGVVKPRRRATLTMPFGPSEGGPGYTESGEVVGVLVAVERAGASGAITISRVRAAAPLAELPRWLGKRPPVPGEWTQTLSEEFDGPKLDLGRWTPRLCWNGPQTWALQRYFQGNVYVEGGNMVIKCEKRRGHQYGDAKLPVREYTTGAVTTLDKWTQRYGYFEARLKPPRALGLWPAFWMMPDRGRGNGNIWQRRATENGGMEFDIFEHLTKWGPLRYNIACHWDGYGKDHKSWGDGRQYVGRTADGFHCTGLLWEPGRATWFCDGKKLISYENDRISNVPEFLKFTVEMGGWGGADVDDEALPDYFLIDYVRAWQKAEWKQP